MNVHDRLEKIIVPQLKEEEVKSSEDSSPCTQKEALAPDLPLNQINTTVVHCLDTKTLRSGNEIISDADPNAQLDPDMNHSPQKEVLGEPQSSSNLMKNWSLYMTNMGSHFRQIAEESQFRSQYLAMSDPVKVY